MGWFTRAAKDGGEVLEGAADAARAARRAGHGVDSAVAEALDDVGPMHVDPQGVVVDPPANPRTMVAPRRTTDPGFIIEEAEYVDITPPHQEAAPSGGGNGGNGNGGSEPPLHSAGQPVDPLTEARVRQVDAQTDQIRSQTRLAEDAAVAAARADRVGGSSLTWAQLTGRTLAVGGLIAGGVGTYMFGPLVGKIRDQSSNAAEQPDTTNVLVNAAPEIYNKGTSSEIFVSRQAFLRAGQSVEVQEPSGSRLVPIGSALVSLYNRAGDDRPDLTDKQGQIITDAFSSAVIQVFPEDDMPVRVFHDNQPKFEQAFSDSLMRSGEFDPEQAAAVTQSVASNAPGGPDSLFEQYLGR